MPPVGPGSDALLASLYLQEQPGGTHDEAIRPAHDSRARRSRRRHGTRGPGIGIDYHSASYNGQGFHAGQRTFTTLLGGPISGQNMVIRASGNVIIPVELMEFEVD